tara:strand:+ start:1338 stop:1481 length:144 start_codon:yes stop_codon:yes gene_type:complete
MPLQAASVVDDADGDGAVFAVGGGAGVEEAAGVLAVAMGAGGACRFA